MKWGCTVSRNDTRQPAVPIKRTGDFTGATCPAQERKRGTLDGAGGSGYRNYLNRTDDTMSFSILVFSSETPTAGV